MNLNEDYFYIDGERFYNLKYTHEQLNGLLKKLEEGVLLTKEQHKQLTEEIGLDNISTFDQNYYNLKNLPYIPVRLGDLYNDVGYDVKARVDQELNTLEEILNEEIIRIDTIRTELDALNITSVLDKIQEAEDKVNYVDKSINDLNGVIFSFERTIELIMDKTSEVENEFEALKNMQEKDEFKLDNINKILIVHEEDIQNLLDLVLFEKDKLLKATEEVQSIKLSVSRLSNYYDKMHNIDLRVSIVEEFLRQLNLDDLTVETMVSISKDIQNFKTSLTNLQTLCNSTIQRLDQFENNTAEKISIIDDSLASLQTTSDKLLSITTTHSAILSNYESLIETINTTIENMAFNLDSHSVEIQALKDKDVKLLLEINNINQSIDSLIKEDEAHHVLLENINKEIDIVQNDIININTIISDNSSRIESLEQRLDTDESWHDKTDTRINDLENDVATNTNSIDDINYELDAVDDKLLEIDDKFKEIDAEILSIETNLETHHEENAERIKQVDETVETLNRRIGSTEANFLTLQSKVEILEELVLSFATKETLNSVHMEMHINEQGFVVVELIIENNIASSIIIPYNVKFEEQIAKVDSARTDYSKTI